MLQLGFAMIPRRTRDSACGFTSGTTSGTSCSIRNRLVLSITRHPAAAARGACTALTDAPGLNKPRSHPAKSNVSRFRTFSTCLSPKLISCPTERADASATISPTGKSRSASVLMISRPTAPVAPATATLNVIARSSMPNVAPL